MTGWVDELGLDRPEAWPSMGVRTDNRSWPEPADTARLALRRQLLVEHPDCIGQLLGAEAAAAEVSALTGAAELAGAAVVQGDDFCILAPEPGWRLWAGAVLFPSHWRLADKLGLSLSAVHGGVPGYPARQVDRFLDRLRPGVVAWRRNLLVHRDGELHSPVPSTEDVPVDEWWLRSERQTFRVLGATGAVLFTIHTDTTPLAGLADAARRSLAARFIAMPDTWAPYAGVGDKRADLIAWLEQ